MLPLDELHQLKYSQILLDLIVRVFVPDLQFEPFQKDIFYMATHPYAEDVQVEPKSLCSFILPLFTEFLVDKNA